VSGRVSDLFGAEYSDLGKLGALVGAAAGCGVELTLDTGAVLTWGVAVEGGKLKGPVHVFPEWLDPVRTLPLRAVREALDGSADKARAFFLSAFDAGVSHKDVMAGLPDADAYRAALDSLYRRESDWPAPVVALVAVRDWAARQKREASAGGRFLDQSASRADVLEVSDADIARAVSAVEAAQGALETALASTAGAASDGQWTREAAGQVVVLLNDLRNAYNDLDEQESGAASIQAELARLDAAEPSRGTSAAVLLTVQDALRVSLDLAGDDPVCMACGTAVSVDVLRDRWTAVADMLDEHRTAVDTRERWSAARSALIQHLTWAGQRLEEYRRRPKAVIIKLAVYGLSDEDGGLSPTAVAELLPQWTEFRDSLPPGVPKDDGAETERLRAAVRTAQAHLDELRRARVRWDAAIEDRARRATAEKVQDSAKRLEQACKERIADLARVSVQRLEESCRPYTLTEERVRFVHDLFGRAVFLPGLAAVDEHGNVSETVRLALSGTEQRRVHLALARAVTPANGPLAVFIPEDRGTDPDTLAAETKLFRNMPQQVIMASTVVPSGRWPTGWTGVCTGRVCPKCKDGCPLTRLWV
jgi:hypothetical protein